MQAFAIPRLDAGAEGIHLVWAWSSVLPLSVDGYDVQRLSGGEQRWAARCETIDAALIALLRTRAEYPAPLGPLRLRGGAKFAPLDAKQGALAVAAPSALLAASPLAAASAGAVFDEFIQELDHPVERATVAVTARLAVAIALRAGKSVALGVAGAPGATIELLALAIDTVVVYALSPQSLTICVYDRPDVKEDGDWAGAPYVAKHLTLPIHETDPGLATPAQELATAQARLVGGETLAQADFERLAATLRDPAAAARDAAASASRWCARTRRRATRRCRSTCSSARSRCTRARAACSASDSPTAKGSRRARATAIASPPASTPPT